MAEEFATGLIPRDYSAFPPGYMAAAPEAPDDWGIPEDEWDERFAEQQANKASLWDLREANYSILKSLNQNPRPLCWGFSTTKAGMYELVKAGTGIILSAWWTAGVSNGWKNQGGWNTLSLEGASRVGLVAKEVCPEFSPRYDTPANRVIAAQQKVLEWFDGSSNKDKNRHLMISAFLLGMAPVGDFNHISHSMCGCRIVQLKPKLIVDWDNSWDAIDQYGPKGCYRMEGSKNFPDGLIIPRVVQPTA